MNTETVNKFRFLLIGEAGSGKSTVLNYLANMFEGEREFDEIAANPLKVKIAIPCLNWEDNVVERFQDKSSENDINDTTKSQTSECYEYVFKSKYDPTKEFRIIDTPGLNDTNGQSEDTKHLTKILKAILSENYLNGILLVLNGTQTRFVLTIQNFLNTLKGFLPKSILENTIIIMTNSAGESNLDAERLGIKYQSIFHMQNNLFKWNKNSDDMNLNMYKIYFTQSMSQIDKLLTTLCSINEVSTADLKLSEELISKLNKEIEKRINEIIGLVSTFSQVDTKRKTIENALNTIKENLVHEKKHTIEAFPILMPAKQNQIQQEALKENHKSIKNYDETNRFKKKKEDSEENNILLPQNTNRSNSNSSKRLANIEAKATSEKKDTILKPVNLDVFIPDNIAIDNFNKANLSKQKATEEIEELEKAKQMIETKLKKKLIALEQYIKDVKLLYKNINLSEKLDDTLNRFSKVARENEEAKDYFNYILKLIEQ